MHGISDHTYYKWKSKYGGMEASDLKGMNEMEAGVSRLKLMYADLAMENHAGRLRSVNMLFTSLRKTEEIKRVRETTKGKSKHEPAPNILS